MIRIDGTHGTLASCKASILKDGFVPSKKATQKRLGNGTYLWSSLGGYGFELAKAWVVQGHINKWHQEKDGVVFICKVDVKDTELADVETEECKAALAEIMDYCGHTDSCAIHNLFIKEYEKKAKCTIKVVKGRVFPPSEACFKGGRIYKATVLGSPVAFAIKEPSMITIASNVEFTI
jgi:hypothetical protein